MRSPSTCGSGAAGVAAGWHAATIVASAMAAPPRAHIRLCIAFAPRSTRLRPPSPLPLAGEFMLIPPLPLAGEGRGEGSFRETASRRRSLAPAARPLPLAGEARAEAGFSQRRREREREREKFSRVLFSALSAALRDESFPSELSTASRRCFRSPACGIKGRALIAISFTAGPHFRRPASPPSTPPARSRSRCARRSDPPAPRARRGAHRAGR